MAVYKMKLEGETVNDTAIRNLKIGKHAYEIKDASMANVKSDVTGKTQQVVIALEGADDYTCRLYLGVLSENDQQREIAEKTLRGIAHAAGLTKGVLDLKKLIGNVVEITAVETTNKTDKTKKYVNVQLVEAYDPDDEDEVEEEEEEEEEAPPAKPAKGAKKPVPQSDPEEEEEEEEEEEDEAPPAPAAGKKKRPW